MAGWLLPHGRDESIGLRVAGFLYGGATALLARAGLPIGWPQSLVATELLEGAKMENECILHRPGDDLAENAFFQLSTSPPA